jgi:hypothetical protein
VAALSYKSYADYDIAEADAVVRLPERWRASPSRASRSGCAMNIFRRSDIQAGQTVAIVGHRLPGRAADAAGHGRGRAGDRHLAPALLARRGARSRARPR